MVDNFEVEKKYENRQHERHQFKLVLHDRAYKGDYFDEEIHWLNPHPKQDVSEEELRAVEEEIHKLLGKHGVRDETGEMEIEPIISNPARKVHTFKLKINGEMYKGTFHDGVIEWFHPKPERKINKERVLNIEEKVHEKMKEHDDGIQ